MGGSAIPYILMIIDSQTDREGILERLRALDEALQPLVRSGEVPVVIVGGSALILQGLSNPERLTVDIDFIEAPMEAVGSMRRLDMNNAAETFPMTMPSGWRGRTCEVPAQMSVLRVETPSPADLCIMKLESGRPKDLADVREMLRRDPQIAAEASVILSDPLEVQVNLEEGLWEDVRDRAAETGIEIEEGFHGPGAQDILEGARGAARCVNAERCQRRGRCERGGMPR